jgi:hypothetical protein
MVTTGKKLKWIKKICGHFQMDHTNFSSGPAKKVKMQFFTAKRAFLLLTHLVRKSSNLSKKSQKVKAFHKNGQGNSPLSEFKF